MAGTDAGRLASCDLDQGSDQRYSQRFRKIVLSVDLTWGTKQGKICDRSLHLRLRRMDASSGNSMDVNMSESIILWSNGISCESVRSPILWSNGTRFWDKRKGYRWGKKVVVNTNVIEERNKVLCAGRLWSLDLNVDSRAQHFSHWKLNVYEALNILYFKRYRMTHLIELCINLRANRKLSSKTEIE